MKKLLSILLLTLLCPDAMAQSQSIWSSPDVGPASSTMKVPVDTSAVSGPGSLSVNEIANYTLAQPLGNSPITATLANTARSLSNHFADVYNAADYGVVCDGTALADLNITNGSPTLSSASYTFKSSDAGKTIVVTDTNETTILNTSIASISSGNAVLAANWTGSSLTNNTGRATFYTTDNTTAINGAISTIVAANADANGHNTKGFKLMFPNGVCATGQITIPRLSLLTCTGGAQACELFEKTGTDADFIVSENFAALTGSGLNYGPTGTYNGRISDPRVPSWYGLQDMHLDCNKLGQTSGRCIAWYGNMQMMLGTVQMEEAYGNCMHTEASDASAWSLSDWKSQEEGIFDHVRTRNCGAYGWEDEGPHDKVVIDFIDAESASTGYHSSLSSGYYSGTGHLVKMHAYAEANDHAFYIGTPDSIDEIYPDYGNLEINTAGVTIAKAFFTAAGYGNVDAIDVDSGAYRFNLGQANIDAYGAATGISLINLKSGSGGATINNVIMTGISSTGSSVIGVNIASAFNVLSNIVVENITGTSSICLSLGSTNNVVGGTGFSCTTFIDPTPDGGNNIVNFTMYGSNFTSGYPFNVSDYVNLTENTGSGTTYFTQTPSNKSSLGELQSTGTAPAVASGAGACGTSTSVVGNNRTGIVTVGSSTNGGVCTLTFANSLSFTHAPICFAEDLTSAARLVHVTSTDTTAVLTAVSSFTAGDTIEYICEGYY